MNEFYSPHQLYQGFEMEDLELLRRYTKGPAQIGDRYYIDGFGQKTELEVVPFTSRDKLNGDRLSFPVPDDGFHAEALEYIALVDAVDRARESLCVVEVGAGWGPWIALAGVLGRTKGLHPLNLVGVEGLPSRFELLRRHLNANGFDETGAQDGEVRLKLLRGAVGVDNVDLYFPEAPIEDMGTAASEAEHGEDYRGAKYRKIKVPTFTMAEILADLPTVDFIHFDVQGSEFEIIAANSSLLQKQVRSLMIATHNRVIEGKLIELLMAHNWELTREKPCRVDWRATTPTLTGKTTVDGCQYWRNLNLEK